MRNFRQVTVRAGGGAAVLAVSVLVAACGGSGGSGSAKSSGSTGTSASSAATGTTADVSARGTAIGTTRGLGGSYLTGAGGRAVYLWVADRHGRSNCSGACAAAWPPVTTKSKPVATGKASASALGTVSRADGTRQVTYDHHPLYYFAGDTGRGTTSGQGSDGFGAKWWLVAPAGSPITSRGSSSSSGSTTTSSYY